MNASHINPADILVRQNWAEKAGSGIDKIRKGWASRHWRSPMVSEQVQPDRVTWRLPMISLIPEESLRQLEELFGPSFRDFDEYEIQALVTAEIEGSVDNARMRQVCGIHAADVTRLLQELVAKGALVQEGQGRWSRDRLSRPGNSLFTETRSLHRGAGSLHSGQGSLYTDDSSLHTTEDPELLTIAAPAREQRRLKPRVMERILLELCTDRWLTTHELSLLVKRNAEGIRQRFLNPMVQHSLLRLRYPDKRNRADRVYTSNEGWNDDEPIRPRNID